MPVPEFAESGDLPAGIHTATLEEVEAQFGQESSVRKQTIERLRRVFHLASSTGHLARFIIFGSFVTAKLEPNDVDIVMLMDNDFEVTRLRERRLFFLTIPSHSRCSARAFSGSGNSQHWEGKMISSLAGRLNATGLHEESSR